MADLYDDKNMTWEEYKLLEQLLWKLDATHYLQALAGPVKQLRGFLKGRITRLGGKHVRTQARLR